MTYRWLAAAGSIWPNDSTIALAPSAAKETASYGRCGGEPSKLNACVPVRGSASMGGTLPISAQPIEPAKRRAPSATWGTEDCSKPILFGMLSCVISVDFYYTHEM